MSNDMMHVNGGLSGEGRSGCSGEAPFAFDPNERYGLAFSGGCDSSYLLAEMMRAGADVKAYMVKSAFQAAFEVEDARRVVEETGADFELIEADVFSRDEICANPWDRCYLCKRYLFGTIFDYMARDGRTVLVDGTNASDDPARRPGFRALDELGVRSPLREAGLTKDDIRERSRAIGLSTADKPNFSCFATKVPEGTRITREEIDRVACALGLSVDAADGQSASASGEFGSSGNTANAKRACAGGEPGSSEGGIANQRERSC
ncbi:ExsB family transcriptional regulator [Raoultibacter phocaeensis]|uniref:ExsB family transcriptional regulator n=1 Tax=Raoultibacter phocaeensis TaxID=2479841 RepID=UPI0015D59EBC|nr:ExsB family transcriptional regulator [Raoultibacter phocaeensis]